MSSIRLVIFYVSAISANEYFDAYSSGILDDSCSEGELNHAVLLVGYGVGMYNIYLF